MKQYKNKMYIITNVNTLTNRVYFYEFTNKKEAEKFLNSAICINTKWDHYELITIDGNRNKRAQSIKIDNYENGTNLDTRR